MNEKTIEYRPFSQDYLDEVVKLWNRELTYDQITSLELYDHLLENAHFLARTFLLAFDEDKLVGFLYGALSTEVNRGWILQLAVTASYQRQHIASSLVARFQAELRNKNIFEIHLTDYASAYFTPGVDRRYTKGQLFFEKLHFIKTASAVSMSCDLLEKYQQNTSQIDSALPTPYKIIIFDESFAFELLAFVSKNFSGEWYKNVQDVLLQRKAEKTILLVLGQNQKIIGFAMRAMDGNPARFGPIGVSPAYRDQGIGSALLEAMLLKMFQQRIFHAFFLWAHGPAVHFYQGHGFVTYREYDLYQKNLK